MWPFTNRSISTDYHCEKLHGGHDWVQEHGIGYDGETGESVYHKCRRCGKSTPRTRYYDQVKDKIFIEGGKKWTIRLKVEPMRSFDAKEAPRIYIDAELEEYIEE